MKKFGTFSGVFVPSFEAILGAVLFLILPMLTGLVGTVRMVMIVALANSVTLATAFSISDCTTNLHRVGAGGMYAISKASLGRAFGGSIGIQLFLAQAASIGFYAVGFAEPLQPILARVPMIDRAIGDLSPLVQKQVIASLVALCAFLVGVIGANFVVKIQGAILVVLILSVGAIVLSPVLAPDGLFRSSPNWTGNLGILGFWAAFAAFFPAVTGIDAGVGMSGNLKNPRRSLPRGTFIAIGVTFVVYVGITVLFGFIEPDRLFGMSTSQGVVAVPAVEVFASVPVIPQLLLLGILVATASSALAYFLTAPGTAQALARDDVLPRGLSFLRRDFIPGGSEPRWATVATLLIVLPVIWSGDVTTASTVVGICFLVVYGWVNLAAFFERVSGNPSFRPTSRGHWAISLYGFLVCMVVISLFDIWIGVGVMVSQLAIFSLILRYRAENKMEGVWWGLLFAILQRAFKSLRTIIQGTKNWRPVLGVYCWADQPEVARNTLEMARRISAYQGLNLPNILVPSRMDAEIDFDLPADARMVRVHDDDFDSAVLSITQSATVGGFYMNTVLLPSDSRVNHTEVIDFLIKSRRNVLLYSHGPVKNIDANRIDVWWKGEENGNLMALLSYIINLSDSSDGLPPKTIRLIRKLFKGEDEDKARREMMSLMASARLDGDVAVLPGDDDAISESIRKHSSDALLILMGMPGKGVGGLAHLFALDRLFFAREIRKFDNLPPVLFVKACEVMNLFE